MRKLNYLLSGLIFFVLLLGCSSTTASTTTLADRITGNYIGIYQSPAGLANDYEIVVTEIVFLVVVEPYGEVVSE